MKSASADAPHEIGKCCADLGRAGLPDKVQALDGQLRQTARCAVFAKMLVFIISSVSMNQSLIFIQWIEKFKNKPIPIELSDNDAEPLYLS